MEDKYSLLPLNKSSIYKTALKNISSLKERNNWNPTIKSTLGALIDSLSSIEAVNYKKVYDINVITAEYLIENIDLSFEAWENPPISKYYDFNIFCEYVLPYRSANEPLSNWRKNAYMKFKPILLDTSCITKDIAIQMIKKSQINYNIGMAKYPYPLTFEEIDLIKWGTCEHLSQYQTLAFRSIGIPSTTDFIPVWANIEASDMNGAFSSITIIALKTLVLLIPERMICSINSLKYIEELFLTIVLPQIQSSLTNIRK